MILCSRGIANNKESVKVSSIFETLASTKICKNKSNYFKSKEESMLFKTFNMMNKSEGILYHQEINIQIIFSIHDTTLVIHRNSCPMEEEKDKYENDFFGS